MASVYLEVVSVSGDYFGDLAMDQHERRQRSGVLTGVSLISRATLITFFILAVPLLTVTLCPLTRLVQTLLQPKTAVLLLIGHLRLGGRSGAPITYNIDELTLFDSK